MGLIEHVLLAFVHLAVVAMDVVILLSIVVTTRKTDEQGRWRGQVP